MTFKKRLPPVGSRPGTLAIDPASSPPRIHVFHYTPESCSEHDVSDVGELTRYKAAEGTTWVDVQGFGDEAKLRAIGEVFGLHPLTLEDATNVPQRAKSDIHREHQLIIARAPDPGGSEDRVEVPQVCLILGRRFLLTFQDRYFGFFDPVRSRIRDGMGMARHRGPGYLAYALLDTLVDHYFPVLQRVSERLEDLEEGIHEAAEPETLTELHRVRRTLVVIRRVGWPQREAIRSLTLQESPFLTSEDQSYLRNVEQHMAQIMEAIDSAREMTTALVDIYTSNVAQRANDIMKVLTLMASIFIPLTFIAGIYGMNFEYMPELRFANAYPAVLASMVAIAVGMLLYFRRKRWL